METLNTAARAAGFAMATSDDVSQETKVEAKPETETWSSSEAIVLSQDPQGAAPKTSAADWFKSLFGLSGGRAPA